MIQKSSNGLVELVENLAGGNGTAYKRDLTGGLMPVNIRLCSEITLCAGSSIGEHRHTDETEIYYIVSGSGLYFDNGKKFRVKSGDCTTCKSGETHALINDTDMPLKLFAVIVLE